MPFKSHLKKAKGDEHNNPYIFRRGHSWDPRAVCKPYIAFHSHLRLALAFDSLGLWFDFMCSFEVYWSISWWAFENLRWRWGYPCSRCVEHSQHKAYFLTACFSFVFLFSFSGGQQKRCFFKCHIPRREKVCVPAQHAGWKRPCGCCCLSACLNFFLLLRVMLVEVYLVCESCLSMFGNTITKHRGCRA